MNYIIKNIKTKDSFDYIKGVNLKDCVNGRYHNKQTLFKAAYNEEGINFSFYCEDDDIFSTMTEFNDNLYEEDVVEIFISCDRKLKKYIEIEISPLENILQLKITNDLKGHFEKEYIKEDIIIRKITKDEKGWLAEFFVPFKFLSYIGKKGDKWLFNAYRIDRSNNGFNFYALNPTLKAEYHHPENFIDLIFD
jgi:hypothetical protein